jgi:hypothetical protein
MNNEVAVFAGISFLLGIGIVFGVAIEGSVHDFDTYDCTIKCPNNSHSIEFNQVCYCEVK